MNEPNYTNNRFWAELPHNHDLDGLCWCEPQLIVINGELDMIREFGKILTEIYPPCTIWKHRKEH